MLMTLPDDDSLYDALLARDPGWDGRVYVAVTSTGIFCRLTCPARKPLRRNCRFLPSTAECIAEGFRPCKRCHPLGPDPMVAHLLAALDADPARRWSEADLTARGLDPSTVRRAFRRATGRTFLDLARQRRLAAGAQALARGGRVIDAQLTAGYDSGSAFRAAFARMLGLAPAALGRGGQLQADWIDTPLGPMIAVACDHALHLLEFADRPALPREMQRLAAHAKGDLGLGRPAPIDHAARDLSAYFAGHSAGFTVPLACHGPPFTRAVWAQLQTIPAGATRSYSQIATALGRPTATRAVARANGANQIAILIPCHRVIGADGSLTGYGGGLWRKERLITLERRFAQRTAP